MKRALILSALLVAGAMPAMAADLPVKAPPPIPAPVWSWTGFYLGANGGYSWGRSSRTVDFVTATGAIITGAGSVTTGGTDLNGGLFGGQIGYNWQTSNWVWGLEADIQWANQRGGTLFNCLGACLTFVPGLTAAGAVVDQKLEWFGTVRGRAGFLFSPTTLLYATGGLAYGSLQTDVTVGGITPAGLAVSATASGSNTRVGWTVGGGAEWKFSPNWSAKLEYLYMDIGRTSNTAFLTTAAGTGIGVNLTSRVTDNIFRAGVNYQFSTY
jgi:outer membrane immunogenic protein